MKKKLISVFSVMALVLGTYTVAMADNTTNSNATGNSLKSFGNVVYTNGEDSVEIYSDDLYILADQLDSFKSKVADQLAEINTYLSSGSNGTSTVTDSSIKIVHTEPSGSDVVDPLTLDFDTLLEGVAASQSIPTDVTEYGYSDGTILYKNSEGELTTDGTEENVEQINISAATPENLSAGSAAWVNGELILGTGADNKAYYNKSDVPQISEFYVSDWLWTGGTLKNLPTNKNLVISLAGRAGSAKYSPQPDYSKGTAWGSVAIYLNNQNESITISNLSTETGINTKAIYFTFN